MKIFKKLSVLALALIIFASGSTLKTYAYYQDTNNKILKILPQEDVSLLGYEEFGENGGTITVSGSSTWDTTIFYYKNDALINDKNKTSITVAPPGGDYYFSIFNTGTKEILVDVSKFKFTDIDGATNDGPFNAAPQSQDASTGVAGGELSLSIGGQLSMSPIILDGVNVQTMETTIPPVTILDATGTGNGWRVSVTATPFKEATPAGGFKAGTTAKVFDSEAFTIGTKAIVAKDGSSLTGVTNNASRQSLRSGEVVLASATKGNGIGKYELQFGAGALQLQALHTKAYIDNVNYPNQATPYASTITWAVTVAP